MVNRFTYKVLKKCGSMNSLDVEKRRCRKNCIIFPQKPICNWSRNAQAKKSQLFTQGIAKRGRCIWILRQIFMTFMIPVFLLIGKNTFSPDYVIETEVICQKNSGYPFGCPEFFPFDCRVLGFEPHELRSLCPSARATPSFFFNRCTPKNRFRKAFCFSNYKLRIIKREAFFACADLHCYI